MKKRNVKLIQTFHDKVLRSIVNVPWYMWNDTIHCDLKIDNVTEEIKKYIVKYENILFSS